MFPEIFLEHREKEASRVGYDSASEAEKSNRVSRIATSSAKSRKICRKKRMRRENDARRSGRC